MQIPVLEAQQKDVEDHNADRTVGKHDLNLTQLGPNSTHYVFSSFGTEPK